MDLEFTIKKYILQNAIKFKGKANPGAIMGKVLGEDPELRKQAKEVNMLIQRILKEVNALSVEEQTALLQEMAPELLEKKEHVQKDIYSVLDIKEGDTIVTAFPPEPSKYPHIGHAKAIILNYELAQRYKGKFILRFEDTNPQLAKKEFYDIHRENYTWMGLSWDEEICASDFMELYYELTEKLINDNKAYLCECDGDTIKEGRMKGTPCACRDRSTEENMALWKKMPTMDTGSIIVRVKIDLTHKNSTMRDPTIMRIVEGEHVRTGTKYRVWPNYDFENSVMDAHTGVTHRLRSKEFEMRAELQRWIQSACGYKTTSSYEFARFNMTGVESSGRVIREKVDSGELIGWDDPTLTTLVALRRRGFLPKALRDFVVSTGMTKNEATLTWDDLILHNRRLLEEEADRFFFIQNPKKVTIANAPKQTVVLNLHPTLRKGGREFTTATEFYITPQDYDALADGKLNRLADCLNFKKDGDTFTFDSTDHTKFKGSGGKIIHWLPQSDELVTIEVMMPDKKVEKGLAEHAITKLAVGDVIQFERFGFCRLDALDGDTYKFWYSHN